jgi:hypothetical protein
MNNMSESIFNNINIDILKEEEEEVEKEIEQVEQGVKEEESNIKKEYIYSNIEAINRILSRSKSSYSPLVEDDNDLFYMWLKDIIKRKYDSKDKEFMQKVFIRDIKNKNKEILANMNNKLKELKLKFELNPYCNELVSLNKSIHNGQQSINQMKLFINDDKLNNIIDQDKLIRLNERKKKIKELLPLKENEINKQIEQRENIKINTIEYQEYINMDQQNYQLLESLGLNNAIENSILYSKEVGQRKHKCGFNFEVKVINVVEEYIKPLVSLKYNVNINDLIIIKNIKFGMASPNNSTSEFDIILCQIIDRPERIKNYKLNSTKFCQILGIIEIKKNPDDIGGAFIGYQNSLQWLSGNKDGYDSKDWITKAYPCGNFDDKLPFIHDGYLFSSESFSSLSFQKLKEDEEETEELLFSLNKDCNLFISDMYFITTDSTLTGVNSKASNWITNKVSIEEEFDKELTDLSAINNLKRRCNIKFPHKLSTYTYINNILKKYQRNNQIYLVGYKNELIIKNEIEELEIKLKKN